MLLDLRVVKVFVESNALSARIVSAAAALKSVDKPKTTYRTVRMMRLSRELQCRNGRPV